MLVPLHLSNGSCLTSRYLIWSWLGRSVSMENGGRLQPLVTFIRQP